eukprot:NODE_4859_length_751_cov_29.603989_g4506_i0.p1 GENE.NODE_4859_length_751_cov_29.603989_g4506_i0~~NODE_4859_length_751_cov_29.603989_g4506_i0.p1  ORF type:complete len:190 (+),score=32.98 NODE_4859_length_751_cov_29.603989_g4506_i0:112-681(+)
MSQRLNISGATSVSVGQAAQIVVAVGDGAGQGPLHADVTALQVPEFDLVVDGRKIFINYTPAGPGKHTWTFKWGDEVIDETFEVDVTGTLHIDPSYVEVFGLDGGKVGQPLTFTVKAASEAGPGSLCVETFGPSPPRLALTRTDVYGEFKGTLEGLDVPGDYSVTILWCDGAETRLPLPGSPFLFKVQE